MAENVRQANLRGLESRGYSIVFNVLLQPEVVNTFEMFWSWEKTLPNKDIWSRLNSHGIHKFHEEGY